MDDLATTGHRPDAGLKSYFIGYDVFGYLLPGLLLVGALAAGNTWVRDRAVGGLLGGSVPDGSGLAATPVAARIVVLVLLSYLVGHLVAALSSLLLEKALLDGLLKYPTARMFDDGAASGAKKLPWLRRVVKTVLAPGYCRPYSPQFIAAFKRRFKRIFGFDFVDYHDVFWLVWSYVSLHHAAAFQRATHFLNLYGFARNTSMALAVAAATPVWWRCWAHPIPVWLWILACAACAYLMFVNYAKLIRRLNDEIYRGFVALPPPNGRRGSRAGRPPRERTG